MKRLVLTIMLFSVLLATGCNVNIDSQTSIYEISSYKDIPGVTDEEIDAIEELIKQRYRFSYGHLFETESFRLSDGTYAGFTIKFCELLSELFGIEFTAEHYYDWETLKQGIDNLTLDFSGDFTTSTEQQEIYSMTTPIAGRTLNIYTLKESGKIISEHDVMDKKIGFLTGTVTADIIRSSYPELVFEKVDIAKTSIAADMLRNGEIDAFVMDAVMDIEFERYDYIDSKEFFTLVHTPVSLTTANSELKPIIAVIDKYLAAGGINKLNELYVAGNREYIKYKIEQTLTAEEKAYLADLATNNKKVTIGIQHDAYPASFYNERDKEFQGITADILSEVTLLTGLEFEPVVSSDELPISQVIAKLKAGEISMATQLMYTESRKGLFIWSDTAYHTTNYALLSQSDYPDLAMHQVFYVNVGTVKGSAHEEMFNIWFPNHTHHIVYNTSSEAFEALENGDIDLLMLSESLLLFQTNYHEKPGFKVNIRFEKTVDSILGYNVDETQLRDIVDKALNYINIEKISTSWLNKNFDYSKKIAQVQTLYVLVFAGVAMVILAVLSLILVKNRRLSKHLMVAVDEAREASKVKSQFLANMSHEIRTPMNAVIGMSELLLSEPLTKRQERYTKDINASSRSLLAIINDILDFSKIEAGKLELNPIDYDFSVLVDNVQSMFKYVAEQKELEFRFEKEGVMPKYLFGDDIRLRQVLTNICGNAVKFTSKGYVMLKITAFDDSLEFAISDTGMGIREDEIPRLFNSFTQADELKNRSLKGTGLGLAISKSFVEMMGGNIKVTSVYGEGTTFTVKIPIKLGNENEISYLDEHKNGFHAPTAKLLVVDDNTLNLKVASGLLSMMFNINADTAESGDAAIELVKSKDYDVVLMDHMMPEKDGIETVREIREMGGKYKDLTIVALTANAVRGAREMFLENGFNGFLSKPIETEKLTEVLGRVLPQDKIVPDTEKEAKESADTNSGDGNSDASFMALVGEIEEINSEIGLSRFSGSQEMYLEMIELFYNKLPGDREKLRTFLAAGDLRNFSILVHGIKSSLSTIGAMELSETAFDLEKASKDDKAEYCGEHYPPFAEKLSELHKKLARVTEKPEQETVRQEGDVEFLLEKTQIALTAADDFDIDTAIGALESVLEFNYGEENTSRLTSALSALKDFDFDTAVDLLRNVLENNTK